MRKVLVLTINCSEVDQMTVNSFVTFITWSSFKTALSYTICDAIRWLVWISKAMN